MLIARTDNPVPAARKSGLDAFRLLCMLSVISAHANVYTDTASHEAAAILSRWSVPFFFLVLGYFLAKKTDPSRTRVPIERTFFMFVMACLVMLPLALAKGGVRQTWNDVTQNLLFSGTYFHLWYLNSMLMGLLVFRLFDTASRRRYLPRLALVCLVASIVLASYLTEDTRYFGRHLMSVAFLWIGTQLSGRVPSQAQSVALVILGIGIETLEAHVLYAYGGRVMWSCPLTAGTVFYAIGMFGIAFHLPPSPQLQRVGQLGARYSGSIYITHLYALAALHLLGTRLHIEQAVLFRVFTIPGALLLNLVVLQGIDRVSPVFIDALLGSRPALLRGVRRLRRLPGFAVRTLRALPART